ncbi:MetQ/NlpA family ABC transporter substrate-binding protein [Clostridium sp. C8-1-8]|jgi:D-methionine transport system substrate-binding protein|uniref:MetQ/NlpA family ABC transporter substrate-binding protein n=1 Tax=Clostridium sp. C8-1-8 TaxID=2698831 RepID=UPI00136897CC|nr:MetQ/NlpA family ABC transporter substrate-binding protein [Clostridium sp. C8-1-8]
MKFKKILTLGLTFALAGSLAACGAKKDTGSNSSNSKNDKVITIGASPTPHAEILEQAVKPLLEKEGYTLNIKVFDDYVLPNTALDEGSIDANYFQHIPYLNKTIQEKGYNLTYTVKVHIEPMRVYSDKLTKLEDIKDGAEIAVPNDATNEARALKLLAKNNLIKVKDGELVTVKDITENPKKLKFTELEATQLPTVLKDVAVAVVNTNVALSAKLDPNKALAVEDKDSPYANVIAVKKGNENSDKIKALDKAINSPEVKKFIEDKYKGSIVAAF